MKCPVSDNFFYIYVTLKCFLIFKLNMPFCKLQMELKWQVNIYHLTFFSLLF